jgi:hypothetical protein
MTKEALAVFSISKKHTEILPGYSWRPPQDDATKINTDACLSLEARKAGVAGVARSSSTTFLGQEWWWRQTA